MYPYNPVRNIVLTFIFAIVFPGCPVVNAQQIVTDGATATQLHMVGKVTDVTTATVQGNTAFNSFKKFNVDQGNTVNLHLPGTSENLINLVHNQKTNINGILNAYKNGQIGGNVYFANPYGVMIGSGGVVNVGSLTLVTPAKEFMNKFFTSPGIPSGEAVSQLMNGNVPVSPSGLITIKGEINARNDVQIFAGGVVHEGEINAGMSGQNILNGFSQLVNVNGFQAGSQLVEENGAIRIVAVDDVKITGKISVDGADQISAGNIEILSGKDITVEKNALVSARGKGSQSNGGNIIMLAGEDAEIDDLALLDARGGDVSGNGGFIEFSAKDTVNVNGGDMKANAASGAHGKILLDPAILNINSDDFTNGADKTFQADERINVNGVTISSRQVNGADHVNGESIGDSGSLFFRAPEIIINPGSKILTHGGNDLKGFLNVIAEYTGDSNAGTPILVKLHVLNSILKGNGIDLVAFADIFENTLTSGAAKVIAKADVKIGTGTVIIDQRTLNIIGGITSIVDLSDTQIGNVTNIETNVSANVLVESGVTLYGRRGVGVVGDTFNIITAHLDNSATVNPGNVLAVFSKAVTKNSVVVEDGIDVTSDFSTLEVIDEADTRIDISVKSIKEKTGLSTGLFVVNEVDSTAESYVGSDLSLPIVAVVIESQSSIESKVNAETTFPQTLQALSGGSHPVSLTAVFDKHNNIAKAGFINDATVTIGALGILAGATDESQVSVNPGEHLGNGKIVGLAIGDYQSLADVLFHKENVNVTEGYVIDVVSIAPESFISGSLLSRKFLTDNFGNQLFYTKLLNFQKTGSKTSSKTFTFVTSSSSSSESSSSQSSSSSSTSTQSGS